MSRTYTQRLQNLPYFTLYFGYLKGLDHKLHQLFTISKQHASSKFLENQKNKCYWVSNITMYQTDLVWYIWQYFSIWSQDMLSEISQVEIFCTHLSLSYIPLHYEIGWEGRNLAKPLYCKFLFLPSSSYYIVTSKILDRKHLIITDKNLAKHFRSKWSVVAPQQEAVEP